VHPFRLAGIAAVLSGTRAAHAAATLFQNAYDRQPLAGASAPGRVNLIGEHLDYNGGPVLPFALDRQTTVLVAPARGWEFVSSAAPQRTSRDPDTPMTGDWTDYIVGVVQELHARGVAPPAASVAVASTLPIGAGLSSSAALTVAAAAGLGRLAHVELTPAELVEIAYHAEHDRVGVRCGRMDQTIAAHARRGTALLFETAAGTIRYSPLPGHVWIIETGTSHRLTGGELNQRRCECEQALLVCRQRRPGLAHLADLQPADLPDLETILPAVLYRRVRHVVTEVARTRAAAEALDGGDMQTLGRLLVAGHNSLRVDYESTVPEADLLVESAAHHGAYGARLTGAGWGGAVVMLAPEEQGEALVHAVTSDFAARYGRVPIAWATMAGHGVRPEPTEWDETLRT
jgi:galactokinase